MTILTTIAAAFMILCMACVALTVYQQWQQIQHEHQTQQLLHVVIEELEREHRENM